MECNIDKLISIFQQMEGDDFDTSVDLKWGYFFFDKDKEKLVTAFKEIEKRDYNLESLHENEDQDWVMQISKIETHTPESLNNRNEAMNKLAKNFDIDLYDGWDVGQV